MCGRWAKSSDMSSCNYLADLTKVVQVETTTLYPSRGRPGIPRSDPLRGELNYTTFLRSRGPIKFGLWRNALPSRCRARLLVAVSAAPDTARVADTVSNGHVKISNSIQIIQAVGRYARPRSAKLRFLSARNLYDKNRDGNREFTSSRYQRAALTLHAEGTF